MTDRMDFIRELKRLVDQIPWGRVATVSDISKALGDEATGPGVFRILRDGAIVGAHRVVRTSGHVPDPVFATLLHAEGVRLVRGRVVQLMDRRVTDFHGSRPLASLREEQRRLAARVVTKDGFSSEETIAGFDLAYDREIGTAAAVVLSLADGKTVQTARAQVRVRFPYIPGYLAYREFPGIKRCFALLDPKPDILMIDGHGILHPARFGIASYVGVALNRSTIGVAKRPYVGDVGPMPREVGGITPVHLDGKLRGVGIRSSLSHRLIYVSVGHLISLNSAVRLTKLMCKTRIPEPLRQAHLLADRDKGNRRKSAKSG